MNKIFRSFLLNFVAFGSIVFIFASIAEQKHQEVESIPENTYTLSNGYISLNDQHIYCSLKAWSKQMELYKQDIPVIAEGCALNPRN